MNIRILLFLLALANVATAQSDSVVVLGKIENLTARIYRQADEIHVVRVNVLSGRDEIVAKAPLQPDGSFRCGINLIFPKEECFLSYGPWVYTPFMAQKGEVSISILADSLGKAAIPFKFSGINAESNNRRAAFDEKLTGFLKYNTDAKNVNGKLDSKTAVEAWHFLQKLATQKTDYFEFTQEGLPADSLLNTWVKSSIIESALASYFDYLRYYSRPLPATILTEIKSHLLFMNTSKGDLLTFARAEFVQNYFKHLLLLSESQTNSIKTSKLAEILLKHAPNLTATEKIKLQDMQQSNSMAAKDLKFADDIFKRNEDVIQLYFNNEVIMRQLGEQKNNLLSPELQQSLVWSGSLKSMLLEKITTFYSYIRPQIQSDVYGKSIDELHKRLNKDSADVAVAKALVLDDKKRKLFGNQVVWLRPETYLYKNAELKGNKIFDQLRREYKGQKLFIVKWVMENPIKVPEELQKMLESRSVKTVYVCDKTDDDNHTELWKELIIRNNLKGVNILNADGEQNAFWRYNLQPDYATCCVLVKENGIVKKAPDFNDFEGWNKILEK